MTLAWRGIRNAFQASFAAILLLFLLAEQSSGQIQETSRDQRCLNCHGQKHITAISKEERGTMVVMTESDLPERKNPAALFVDPGLFSQSFHSRVTCEGCHSDAADLPHAARLSEPQCETCHEAEAADVSRSRHAKVIRQVDPRPPRCWDCHGAHEIRLQHKVSPQEKIKVCASCHQKYAGQMAGLPSGGVLVRSYLDSVHGQNNGKSGAQSSGATCEDCHGHHEILPAQDPRSQVNRSNIPETCGRCHPDVRLQFESTVHAEIERRHDPRMRPALCNNCHTAHAITHINTPEFTRDIVGECGSCHSDLYRTYRETYHGQVQQLGSRRVAKCSDCHGTHNILRPKDPKSLLSAVNRPATCGRCHEEIKALPASAQRNFVAYHPHAEFRDLRKHPLLSLIWRFTLISGVILLILWGLHWVGWLSKDLPNKLYRPVEGVSQAVVRFNALHRWTHSIVLGCVLGLIVTGIPLKFSRQSWIGGLMALFGGPDAAGLFHRLFATALVFTGLFHGLYPLILRRMRKQPLQKRIAAPDSLWLTRHDIQQFKDAFRWFIGRGPRPNLDRWCYREKFDYWAAIVIVAVLAASGLFLWFPTFFARLLSGYWFNVAMIVHGYAGLLASGLVLMIHLLNTSLRKEGFPINDVMFTGQLSEKEFQLERGAQYTRLAEAGTLNQLRIQPISDKDRKTAFWATAILQALGVVFFILIVCATIF